jgi:hypothetical protein
MGSVLAWINDPRVNVIEGGRKGFLLNRLPNRPLAVTSTSTGTTASIRYWDGRSHFAGADRQYWELQLQSNGKLRIKNMGTGRCLSSSPAGFATGRRPVRRRRLLNRRLKATRRRSTDCGRRVLRRRALHRRAAARTRWIRPA